MRNLTLTTESRAECKILIGNCQEEVASCLESAGLVVADKALVNFHPVLAKIKDCVLLEGGEKLKTLSEAENLYRACKERSLMRTSSIVAVGGGTIGDLVGFVASTYLRGLRFTSVPTSLLAQVDASIGGKNGLNFQGAKNQIGTIAQPTLCICDIGFLTSLSKMQLSEGYAEIIKHGIIASRALFDYLAARKDPFSLTDIEEIVYQSILIKKQIVEADELETGERRKLNFGHTIGHAIESSLSISHGEAVSIGMALEFEISKNRGLLSDGKISEMKELMRNYGLPTTATFNSDKVAAILTHDKKREGKVYHLPLVTNIGSSDLFEVDESELREAVISAT